MRKRHVLILAVVAVIGTTAAYNAGKGLSPVPSPAPTPVTPSPAPLPAVSGCDPNLWAHVYTGDPRKFSRPQDRLKVIQDCISVTGVIVNAKAEADGDYHVRLNLDPQYQSMLNAKNVSGQHGYLVLEPVCANPVSQKDTLQEGSCNGFSQKIFNQSMVGKHVEVVGAYVTDMEHLWNEIHPVTSISVK